MAVLELEKVCLTCFQPSDLNFLNVQSEKDSLKTDVLKKHFWFTEVDFQRATICLSCWGQVHSFHKFYLSVEELHHNRLVSLVVKSEPEIEQNDDPVEPAVSGSYYELTEVIDDLELTPLEFGDVTEATDPDNEHQSVHDGEELAKFTRRSSKQRQIKYAGEEREPKKVTRRYKSVNQQQLDDEYMSKHVNFDCQHCEQKPTTFRQFYMHSQTDHGIKIPHMECCGLKFSVKTRLLQHVQHFYDPKAFRCEPCQVNFTNSYGLQHHMKQVHVAGKKLLIRPTTKSRKQHKIDDDFIREHLKSMCCKECGEECSSFKEFRKHNIKEHDSKMPFVECCGMKFHNKTRLFQHVQSLTNPDQFRCDICQKSFPYNTGLQVHMKKVHDVGCKKFKVRKGKSERERKIEDVLIRDHVKINCSTCGQECHTFKLMKKHALEAHGIKRPYLVCCEKRFQCKTRLFQHVQLLKNSGMYHCEKCGKNFPHSFGYKRHVKEVHESGAIYITRARKTEEQVKHEDDSIREHVKCICRECGQERATFGLLTNHAREAHGKRNASLLCCGKLYSMKTNLLEHVKSIANPDRLRCEECNKSYKGRESYRRHMKVYHPTDEQIKFKCEQCPSTFPLKYLFDMHLEDHLKNNKWKCEHCTRVCQSRKALEYHTKRKHGTLFNYVCDICSMGFNQESWLKEHKQGHENPKVLEPMQCEVCFKWMKDYISLRNHLRFTHPQSEAICEICERVTPNQRALASHKRRVHNKKTRVKQEAIETGSTDIKTEPGI